jgi:hypothetical protein
MMLPIDKFRYARLIAVLVCFFLIGLTNSGKVMIAGLKTDLPLSLPTAFDQNGTHIKNRGALSKGDSSSQETVTPEMYGAIGDGKIHKLSTRFSTLDDAHKEFPGAKDLDITIDGAAFQKAIDIASKNGGKVMARKNYAINFPLITRSNVIIDGNNTGYIYNDRSRKKDVHHLAFFFGDYSASAFYRSSNNSGGFILYPVKGSIAAGQDYVQLANPPDISSFKTGQLIMVTSVFKRTQAQKRILLPYHITISKITRIEGGRLYFEYPIDEDVDLAQVAANGDYDPIAEINFDAVENVTVRNFTVDAEHLTIRTYGYKCHIDNVKIINGIRVIGLNAMAHSTITNISGTFAWRGIEIKTGSSDVLVRNIKATYQAIPGFDHCIDAISLGQYNRNIVIDSFNIDIADQSFKHALIDLHGRKATISNGTINCKNQKKPFLAFYNEHYVSDPRFGCYANTVRNVKFYGGPAMKTVMVLGDDEEENKEGNKKQTNGGEEDDEPSGARFTANVPPTKNIVENCLFDAGSEGSTVDLIQGEQNILRNCIFTNARLVISRDFQDKNIIRNNREKELIN